MNGSFQWIRQHDSMQCGIACLAMICWHYGKRRSIDALSRICFATTEGVSMLGLKQAAERLGLETMTGRLPAGQLSEAGLPCILHWNQNHFVVLYRVSKECGGAKIILSGRNHFFIGCFDPKCDSTKQKAQIYLPGIEKMQYFCSA